MLPVDYTERVYAGVLGKIIAVYLGRPFEGWTHSKISDLLGEVTYYVNDRLDVPLKHHLFLVTDDDISGTFIFARALRDADLNPSSVDIGATWLNYVVEDRCVLWWGGLGNSTEHTAYLRMKDGVAPPESGSMRRNGQVVAEQVGAQIFVEGFALTCPGDLAGAADLAERAARVSHDGAAVDAARVVAALVAGAFISSDMDELLDQAITQVPAASIIAAVHGDVRRWAKAGDWRLTRARIEARYGYDKYGGNCHVVPNHAIVVAALAHSRGDFDTAMTIVTSSGWDTDSNAGNVGAICGVFGGLAGLSTQDWRGPVADRLYLPSADGGACVTDAATEALALAACGRARHGLPPEPPGPRFSFRLAGSVQGFMADGGVTVHNPGGRLVIDGAATVVTPTFIPDEARTMPIYGLVASPTLYPGQTVRAAASGPARLVLKIYTGDDGVATIDGPPFVDGEAVWTVPKLDGLPVMAIGIRTDGPAELHYLTWEGAPEVTLTRPSTTSHDGANAGYRGGVMWRRAWVDAVDRFDERWPEPFRLVQNRGTGLLITGTRDWRDYSVTADVCPHLAQEVGLAARVQGLRRGYALRLVGRDRARFTRGDDVLAEVPYAWEFGRTYQMSITADGPRLTAAIDDTTLFDLEDRAYDGGGVAVLITEGRTATNAVHVTPVPARPRENPT
jgi:ADP-ribosylglycohydrolase